MIRNPQDRTLLEGGGIGLGGNEPPIDPGQRNGQSLIVGCHLWRPEPFDNDTKYGRNPRSQATARMMMVRTPKQFEKMWWLITGSMLTFLTFGLIVWALLSNDSSCDKWTTLKFALPLFPGLAAGAFVGAMNVKGRVGNLAVAATGGFAVWLLAVLTIPEPNRCGKPIFGRIVFFESDNPLGALQARSPASLDRNDRPYIVDPGHPEQFVLFLGTSVRNIYQGPGRSIHLRFEVTALRDDKTIAWAEARDYQSLDEWRVGELANRFTVSTIERKLGLGDTSDDNVAVILLGIECKSLKQLTDWNGELRFRAIDTDDPDGNDYRFHQVPSRVDIVIMLPSLGATGAPGPGCQT